MKAHLLYIYLPYWILVKNILVSNKMNLWTVQIIPVYMDVCVGIYVYSSKMSLRDNLRKAIIVTKHTFYGKWDIQLTNNVTFGSK